MRRLHLERAMRITNVGHDPRREAFIIQDCAYSAFVSLRVKSLGTTLRKQNVTIRAGEYCIQEVCFGLLASGSREDKLPVSDTRALVSGSYRTQSIMGEFPTITHTHSHY